MSDRNPNVAQSDDDALQADLVRLLNIIGPLGRLNVLDFVVPTVSLGEVRRTSLQPFYGEFDVFTAGVQTAAPAFFNHADTGALDEGIYDVQLYISPHTTESHVWNVRLATPSATQWSYIVPVNGSGLFQTIGLEILQDKSLSIQNTTVFGAGVQSVATIFARRRI